MTFEPNELRVLHKAIMDAKFREGAQPELIGSALLASAARKIAGRLENTFPNEGWAKWLSKDVGLRPEFGVAVTNAKLFAVWKRLDRATKREVAEASLGPFVPSGEEIEAFVREVDDHFAPLDVGGSGDGVASAPPGGAAV